MAVVSDKILQIINRSIQTITTTELIEDWEFAIVLGIERSVLSEMRKISNPLDSSDLDTSINVLLNLVGYPHGKKAIVEESVGFSTSELKAVLDELIKLREESGDNGNS